MKIPKSVVLSLGALFAWSLVAGFLLDEVLKDDGLYAQIAVPFIFGIVHIIVTLVAISQVYFIHKSTLNWKLKLLFGIFICFPIGIAVWKIPLFNALL